MRRVGSRMKRFDQTGVGFVESSGKYFAAVEPVMKSVGSADQRK